MPPRQQRHSQQNNVKHPVSGQESTDKTLPFLADLEGVFSMMKGDKKNGNKENAISSQDSRLTHENKVRQSAKTKRSETNMNSIEPPQILQTKNNPKLRGKVKISAELQAEAVTTRSKSNSSMGVTQSAS